MLRTGGLSLLLALATAIAWFAACSTRPESTDLGSINVGSAAQRSGEVDMHLTIAGSAVLPNGATIASLNYSIAGPTITSGSLEVSASQSIEFVVGNLSAGSNYTILLSAQDSAGDKCTSGSTPFTVTAGKTTQVALDLVCFVVTDSGSGAVADGSETGCVQPCTLADAGPDDVSPTDATLADGGPAETGSSDGTACVDQTDCNAFVNTNRSTFLLTDNGACTATELTLYAKTVSGQATGSCLACAAMGSCLDDSFDASDVLRECEDAPASTDAEAAGVSECLAALACGLGVSGSCGAFTSHSAAAQGMVTNCYCGAGVTTADCTASSSGTDAATGPQGACVAQETAGFPSAFTPAQIVSAFQTPSQPAGLANQLLACLNAQCSTQCFP